MNPAAVSVEGRFNPIAQSDAWQALPGNGKAVSALVGIIYIFALRLSQNVVNSLNAKPWHGNCKIRVEKEEIMFHVLDHADVVYTGELSQATRYVMERYGIKLDEAIRSGIKIAYTDSLHSTNQGAQTTFCSSVPDFWKPHEEWTLD